MYSVYRNNHGGISGGGHHGRSHVWQRKHRVMAYNNGGSINKRRQRQWHQKWPRSAYENGISGSSMAWQACNASIDVAIEGNGGGGEIKWRNGIGGGIIGMRRKYQAKYEISGGSGRNVCIGGMA